MLITGLDLSLASTGVAGVTGGRAWAERIKPHAAMRGHARMSWLLSEICSYTSNASLVLVEGPSFGSPKGGQQGHHERAGLWWLATHRLWRDDIPTVIIPPNSLKLYATGKGNASKDAVFAAAIRRYPDVEFDGNDQADALILAAMGADYLGFPLTAFTPSGRKSRAILPAKNRAALDAISWPEELLSSVTERLPETAVT